MSLHVEDLGDGVRALTLKNEARRNALDEETLRELERALSATDVRAWLVRGHRGHFCAGYDLKALERLTPKDPMPDDFIGHVLDALSAHPAPSVAHVAGAAYGAGLELACACDFRVADATCAFSVPPAKLGIVYAPKGVARIARVVGLQKARVLLLSARRVAGNEALAFGLADEMGDEARAVALAKELAAHAPLAVSGMKRVIASLETRTPEDFTALRRQSFASEDVREGLKAMAEKRAPKFSGR